MPGLEKGGSACKEGLCTVAVGEEGLTQGQQISGFIVAVGVGTVLESGRDRGISCVDPGGYDSAKLREEGLASKE